MLKLQSAEVGTEAVYTYEEMVAEGADTEVTVGYGHNDTADSFDDRGDGSGGRRCRSHHQAGRCLGIPLSGSWQ